MADDTREIKPDTVNVALGDMKLEEGTLQVEGEGVNGIYDGVPTTPGKVEMSGSSTPATRNSASQSPVKKKSASLSPSPKSEVDEDEEVIGGGITLTVEPGKGAKLSRKSSQKVVSRPAPIFDHLPDATEVATSVFQVIKDCIYGSKYMGYSEHDSLDCDCSEEWSNGKNHACGEDSDCINRATKMECVDGDCNCGLGCQNQRFQRKEYANVSVIETAQKGYGLRANTDLYPNEFIFEYIGEVINEPTFRRRTIQYDEEGIKHFYFMSLTKNEFVDATKKGNLGRFCNHSCNPNCYVDKWVVGEKLRMGIFAERHIKAGEELVFNYNVDRYGADPQPCYCDEPNCTGFIGGKTQTERATKLSHATIEALGIDDGDGWDTAVAKKPRKKKTGEDDEEYVNNVQPRGLDEDGVRKVMATLMQCKEKWIAVKLLSRIQRCNDDKVRNRVVQMHGYQILRSTLTTFQDDNNVVLQIFDILYKFPRLTRNKISDSKIEPTVEAFVNSEHEDVAFEAKRLLEEWGKLEVAYRIPRKKFDPNAVQAYERRNAERVEESTKSPAPALVAPTGPRNNVPQRTFVPRPPIRRPFNPLPTGWFTATDEKGNTYYYSKSGQTTWQKPYLPAAEPPPPPKAPPKSVQTQKALQDIIQSIIKSDSNSQTPSQSAATPQSTPKEKKHPSEKWRSLPQEKQMKLYENTLFPHIKYVMQKFTKQLPKEDLKKFAKEVGKKLVASDFKNSRVEDPTKISEKQEKKVKKYVRDYFEKAVEKRKILDKKKREKLVANGTSSPSNADPKDDPSSQPEMNGKVVSELEAEMDVDEEQAKEDSDMDLSGADRDTLTQATQATPSEPPTSPSPDLKRKREAEEDTLNTEDTESNKRLKEGDDDVPTPPPPPPPPAEGMPETDAELEALGDEQLTQEQTEEEKELRRQEEELMRENEEAMMMDLDGAFQQNSKVAIDLPHTTTSLLGDINGNGTGVEKLDNNPDSNAAREREEVMSH
ncbi:Histone-lysine N-methyltransferase [Venustampulla echinocandica]|uniref:Histone-lysine N-methyltransferase, H3 lysine-36 specific n=1 Tax=Venustampulla echinocandica TaxID=2656787 RepID=A0A370TUV6_9HELO|nr:Histone-lysine N-methyltransferase [Venustampulla echinocandica]RDL39325.1 Histone-lysine N-methyltransferase [Venustampulla echinocandica]